MNERTKEMLEHIYKYGNSSMYTLAKSMANYDPMTEKQETALFNIYRSINKRHKYQCGDGPSTDGDCYNMDPSYMGNPYDWE